MAVTIAETGGHDTETALRTPPKLTGHDHRNDRSHSPKYAGREVQLLLGHVQLESTVRYLVGIEVNDALEISEQTEI
jgi:hypothetical protein